MIFGGQWYLGPGDSSPEIRKIKDFCRRMYRSYMGHLADTELYDDQMFQAVFIMQGKLRDSGRLPADKVNGLIGASTKVAMGYLKATVVDIRPVLLTACGTGVPWWVGPDADIARAVEYIYKWRPIGYPAAPFPMGKSIDAGVAMAITILEEERGRIERYGLALAGYSQGAYIISVLWQTHIEPVNGRLHWAKKHIRRAVLIGNPKREVGKAWPDPGAPVAKPDTGGVDEELLVNTPSWWREYAHDGDLYTAAKNDESRENKTAIWKIIRGSKIFSGPDAIWRQVLEVLVGGDSSKLSEVWGIFVAIRDAGMFLVKRTGPHLNYHVGPAIDYLRSWYTA